MSSQYNKRLPSSSTHLLISSYLQRILEGFSIQQNHRHEVCNSTSYNLFYLYSKLQGIRGLWPNIPSHPPWKHRNSGCARRYGQLRYSTGHFNYNCAHTVATFKQLNLVYFSVFSARLPRLWKVRSWIVQTFLSWVDPTGDFWPHTLSDSIR